MFRIRLVAYICVNKNKQLENMKKQAQKFCKEYNLKLIEMTSIGFVARKTMPVKAGMETDVNTGRLVSIPIRKIGSKHVLQNFKIHSDGDIQQVRSQN